MKALWTYEVIAAASSVGSVESPPGRMPSEKITCSDSIRVLFLMRYHI